MESDFVTVVERQTRYKKYLIRKAVNDLQVGDVVPLTNFRNSIEWEGEGTFEEGWLIGELLGDGCLSTVQSDAYLRFWGTNQNVMANIAVSYIQSKLGCRSDFVGFYSKDRQHTTVKSAALTKLSKQFGLREEKCITNEIENASWDFYRGILRGLIDSDGSVQGTQTKGVSIRLSQSNLPLLYKAQSMLYRLGIICTIYENRREKQYKELPNGKGGYKEYLCKPQHELVISRDNIKVFYELINFYDPDKRKNLDDLIGNYQRSINRERFTTTIESVFQIQTNDANKIVPVFPLTIIN